MLSYDSCGMIYELSPRTIRRYVTQGRLRAYRIDGYTRIKCCDAASFFTSEPWEPRQSA